MTNSFTYELDPRRQIAALAERQALLGHLQGRSDVVGLGALLRDALLQTGDERKRLLSELACRLPSALPEESTLARHLVGFVEFDPRHLATGAAVPAGVRHPTITFSVPLQVAAAYSEDGCVGGVPVWQLPVTRPELLCHLYSSIGLHQPAELGSSASSQAEVERLTASTAELFHQRFGFALEDLADKLLEVLRDDPDLYILILSREQAMVSARLQELAPLPVHQKVRKAVPVLKALQITWELQRAALMTWTLRRWRALTFYDVRDVSSRSDLDDPEDTTERDKRVRAMFNSTSGFAPISEPLMMQVAALKRFLRQRPDARLPLDTRSLQDALSTRSLNWNQEEWVRSDRGLNEFLQALAEKSNMLKRVKGKGLGHHAEQLDTYCGVSAYQLPLLAIGELGRKATGRADDATTNELAEIMHHVLLGPNLARYGSGGPEHARRQASKFSKTYLPAAGRVGSAGRFDASMWAKRYRDGALYRRVANYVYDPRQHCLRSSNRLVRRIGIALLFLVRRFQKLYIPTTVTRDMVEITCDLATAVSVLTTDPVFKALLNKVDKLEAWFTSAPVRKKAR